MFPIWNNIVSRMIFSEKNIKRFDPFSSQNTMGFNPFEYKNHQYQENNPFSSSFFTPLQPNQNQVQYQDQNQETQFWQQSLQNSPFQQSQNPSHSQAQNPLFRNVNGKVNGNKIANGAQNALNLYNQVGPMVKMLNGFLR